jgi:hypothetical protein
VERTDRAVVAAQHDQRQIAHLVDDVVANARDLLLTARDLPDALPEALHLERVELR